ncbi:MAG: hypothetical protein CBD32_03250 [Actinobacteria bacterium TMED172]|nr:hypothetical protein [Cellvibrionales bacterium]OUW33480.1 MAG: hypothetical protein CBD32_03250 [Actinobacteria bacterium TMED172]|tara:strand:- start:9829 stop:10338 length:510 start_codon:yes stop_codon:yes gene_type:complete
MSYLLRSIAYTFILFSFYSNATIIYNDRIDADLSNLQLQPSFISDIGSGSFDVLGNLSNGDLDFFSVNLVGSTLDSIELTEWSNTYNAQWTFYANGDWYDYLNQSVIGENLINALGLDTSGSQLVIGTRTGALALDYGFRITTTNAIPIPAAAWLFGSALVGLGLVRKK